MSFCTNNMFLSLSMLKEFMKLKLEPQISKGNQEDCKRTLVNGQHNCVVLGESLGWDSCLEAVLKGTFHRGLEAGDSQRSGLLNQKICDYGKDVGKGLSLEVLEKLVLFVIDGGLLIKESQCPSFAFKYLPSL